MWLNLTAHKSMLIQVKAWCRQASRHYLNQCWPSFMMLHGIARASEFRFYTLRPSDAIWSILVQVIGNCLLPDGTQPLSEPMLTNHQWGLLAFTSGQFHQKISQDVYPWFMIWKLHVLISDYSHISQGPILRPSDSYMYQWTGSSLVLLPVYIFQMHSLHIKTVVFFFQIFSEICFW